MASTWLPSVQQGLAVNRPSAPDIARGTLAFYLATDTGILSVYYGNTWSVDEDNNGDGQWAQVGAFASLSAVQTVAAAGTNQATAAALNPGFNQVTGASGTNGVTLPTAPVAGTIVKVKNTSASEALLVYPDPAATINAIASHGDLSMAEATIAEFIAYSPTQWYSLPLLPS